MSLESVADKALKEVGNKFQDIAWTTGIITLLLSPITVIGNGLVLASILLDPFKNIRRSPSSNLIFNLALTDFLMGLVTDPLAAVWHIYTASNSIELYSSKIMFILAIILVGVSTCSLVALSVDRRIAVTTPLQYAYRVTKRKIRIAIVCIWCHFILGAIIWSLLQPYKSYKLPLDVMVSVHLVIASIILAVLNVAVIRSVRTQAFNIKNAVDSENVVIIKNAFSREKAVTQTLVIMVVAFEICSWPFIIISSIAHRALEVTNLNDFKVYLWMYFLSHTLVLANSLMNPFLYAWRLQKYRKALRYIIYQLKNNIFGSETQTQSNSQQLSTIEDNNKTLMPVMERYKHYLKTTHQPALCSHVQKQIDVQECNYDKAT